MRTDLHVALARAAEAALDWAGGTRLGTNLAGFVDGYGHGKVLRGAVVVILSDGWECGNPEALAAQMARLRRRAYRIVWVNPRKAAPGYAPLVGGMAAALPHCDAFASGHSLTALAEVAAAIRADRSGPRAPQTLGGRAMKLDNTFSVTAPIERVWTVLMDANKVASCVPGAQVLDKHSADSYVVGIRVKLGPISMQYRGQMDVVMRDEAARRATLRGKAKETRGQGTAEATVELALTQQEQQTHGTVQADVRLSGRAAAMGQGVITSVADQMLGQFAHNLEVMLNEPQSSQPAAGDPGDAERSGDNVVEGVERLAAGTQSAGVQTSPQGAKPRRAPVEQVRGDEDMTEGR